jgi:uncharacterized protein DUF3306
MSDVGDFLTRWSRRKRAAAKSDAQGEAPQHRPEASEAQAACDAAGTPPSGQAPPPVDAPPPVEASLPPIESIDATTDIRAFLKAGVPAELARAALRRAWSSDPGIRDFVGLSENAWDFNAPAGVPGFGAISPEEVRQLLSQAIGESDRAAAAPQAQSGPAPQSMEPPTVSEHRDMSSPAQQPDLPAAAPAQPQPEPNARGADNSLAQCDQIDIASQDRAEPPEPCQLAPRRNHGGALPA